MAVKPSAAVGTTRTGITNKQSNKDAFILGGKGEKTVFMSVSFSISDWTGSLVLLLDAVC